MVSRVLKNSIFLRIYAGLVVLVVVVAVFCYLLVQIINYQRAQEYRESLTDGISYVISEDVARQPEKQQKLDWISDASDLLELPIYYVDATRAIWTGVAGVVTSTMVTVSSLSAKQTEWPV